MRIHKLGQEMRSVEDWFKYAPPKLKERQWKDKRSAKELARSWFRDGNPKPPPELVALLQDKFHDGITADEAKPECIIELDDFPGEHRNCDLVVLCGVGAKCMVINIEAKADEPFGDLIGEYLDRMNLLQSSTSGQGSVRPSNVPKRIRHLALALFGRKPDEGLRELRYQLLHGAAATLIEADKTGADTGLFLVHEFRSDGLNRRRLTQNSRDLEDFVHAFPELATVQCQPNQILGPVLVPGGGRVPNDVPLCLGKLLTELD